MQKRTYLFFVLSFLTTTSLTYAVSTVYVDSTYTQNNTKKHTFGIDAFTTIQEGINAVENNGTVIVAKGVYKENITIEKSLSLLGEGSQQVRGSSPLSPILNGGESTNPASVTVNGISSPITVTIRNFTIIGGGNGINVLQNAHMTVTKNTVYGYRKNGITFGPVLFPGHGGIQGTISNNIVIGNGPTNLVSQNGIQVSENNTATITGNIVSNHIYTVPNSWWGVGILIHQSSNVSIINNLLLNNQTGINLKESSKNTVTGNVIKGNELSEAGIFLSKTDNTSHPVTDNIIDNNSIQGGKTSILAPENTDKNIFTKNIFNNKITEINTNKNLLVEKDQAKNQGEVLGVSAFAFLKNLKEGDTGADVVELQKILKEGEYYNGEEYGSFDILTKNALMMWQEKNNIPQTGYVGPKTRALLNARNN